MVVVVVVIVRVNGSGAGREAVQQPIGARAWGGGAERDRKTIDHSARSVHRPRCYRPARPWLGLGTTNQVGINSRPHRQRVGAPHRRTPEGRPPAAPRRWSSRIRRCSLSHRASTSVYETMDVRQRVARVHLRTVTTSSGAGRLHDAPRGRRLAAACENYCIGQSCPWVHFV